MPETVLPNVLPNVLTALIVFAGGAGLTWLTALFFVKVVKWPSEKTIRRWDRRLEGNQGYAGPSFWTGMLGLFVPFFIGIGITMYLDAPSTTTPTYTLLFERDRPSLWPGALAGWVLTVVGSWWAGRWWSRSRPQHPINKESIFTMWREVRALERDLKRDRDAPGSGR